jgi:hypothetical protein
MSTIVTEIEAREYRQTEVSLYLPRQFAYHIVHNRSHGMELSYRLSTMVYAVPEQRALAWGGGFGGCGGFFGFHKHIIQTISQTNTCSDPPAHTPSPTPPSDKVDARGGIGGSGGAGGSGGEGGQGGVGDTTSTSNANINQKANGGNSNGGHAGNANGGDAIIHDNGDDQQVGGSDQQAGGNDQHEQNQKDKQTVCLNTAVNNAGRGLGANGVGSDNLGQLDVPAQN